MRGIHSLGGVPAIAIDVASVPSVYSAIGSPLSVNIRETHFTDGTVHLSSTEQSPLEAEEVVLYLTTPLAHSEQGRFFLFENQGSAQIRIRAESLTEIDAAVKEMEFQIHEAIHLCGQTAPSAQDGVFAYQTRVPLGVVSVISPWNFPFNVPGRKCTPALMAGNTVVFKPASLTPGTQMHTRSHGRQYRGLQARQPHSGNG